MLISEGKITCCRLIMAWPSSKLQPNKCKARPYIKKKGKNKDWSVSAFTFCSHLGFLFLFYLCFRILQLNSVRNLAEPSRCCDDIGVSETTARCANCSLNYRPAAGNRCFAHRTARWFPHPSPAHYTKVVPNLLRYRCHSSYSKFIL